MSKFRKIPVEIEAWQWNGERAGQMRGVCQCDSNTVPHLHTAHENSVDDRGQLVFLSKGDWIIPESEKPDRYYPCKPNVFAKTYEPADTPQAIVDALMDAAMDGTGMFRVSHVDLRPEGVTWIAPRDAEPQSGPLDPATPTCEYCGARVFDPCSQEGPIHESESCRLPPDTIYVDDRRKNKIGGPGVAIGLDDPMHPVNRDARFLEVLTGVINGCSRENGSATPDFILGQFLLTCLTAFDVAVSRRTKWYKPEDG